MRESDEARTGVTGSRATNERAVVTDFGGPDVIDVIDEPTRPEPGAEEVRVAVEASSAVFTDTLIRRGIYPNLDESPPFTPGYDLVGVVDRIGEGVSNVAVGDRVADLTTTGANAEYVCRPADGVVPVPEEIDPVAAEAMVLSYLTAFQMYHRVVGVESGDTVLVHGGSGQVGTALLQLGRDLGLDMVTTASARSAERMDDYGATIVPYTDGDFVDQLRDAAGEGFDAVFDAVGPASYLRSYRLLKPGGTLVAYGFTDAVRDIEERTLGTQARSVALFGASMGGFALANALGGRSASFYAIGAMRADHPEWFAADLAELFDLLAAGRVDPVVARRVPLDEAARAHELLDDGLRGRIVLVTDGE